MEAELSEETEAELSEETEAYRLNQTEAEGSSLPTNKAKRRRFIMWCFTEREPFFLKVGFLFLFFFVEFGGNFVFLTVKHAPRDFVCFLGLRARKV